MDRLRKVIAQYGRWSELAVYIDRIEAHSRSDFSHAIENAKALLETIGKEVCESKNLDLGTAPSINAVLKKAFSAIGLGGDDMVTQISSSLANIGQNIGNLRNEISPTSHGKSLEELQKRNDSIDGMTREFLIDSTVIVAIFLIRNFENEKPPKAPKLLKPVPLYDDDEAFNEFWDELYGEFEMGSYSFSASEILFNVDNKAYLSEQQAYLEDGDGTDH